MRLEYQLHFADLFVLSVARLCRSWPFCIGAFTVCGVFAAIACKERMWLFFILGILLFCATLSLAALLLAVVLFQTKSLLQLRSLCITERGLIESGRTHETVLEWKDVVKTREGIRTLSVHYGDSGRVLMVPVRAFRTRQEVALFYHTVMQNAHAARALT